MKIRRIALLALLVVICTGFTLLLALDFSNPEKEEPPPAVISPVQPQSSSPRRAASTENIDFSKFSHKSAAHARLSCLLCHRREDGGDRPARPGHTPCAGCHSQQFANAESPMCTICHTKPAAAAIKPFPRLKSFGASFNHSAHSGVNCATCHKPTRQGVALSIPTGVAAHKTCYQCHAAQAQAGGRDISSCGTCHGEDPNRMGGQSTRAFRVNFSHAEHGRKQGLNCSQCHSVRAGAAAVTSPQPAQHKASARAQSCMSCHNGKRAFGGENFSDCKRCHTGDNFSFAK
ncbi:MAG TPA: cytochrome c3 family protein [Blastocatellia bacterium]